MSADVNVPNEALEDARKILGAPPHNHPMNFTYSDPYFGVACDQKYGALVFAEACRRVQEEMSRK